MTAGEAVPITKLDVSLFVVPTEKPEADGTLTWDKTTVVAVEFTAGGVTGLGFSYATGACATLIHDVLEEVVVGADAMDVPWIWGEMVKAIRNLGRPGVVSMAIAAVDTALWDLATSPWSASQAGECRGQGRRSAKAWATSAST